MRSPTDLGNQRALSANREQAWGWLVTSDHRVRVLSSSSTRAPSLMGIAIEVVKIRPLGRRGRRTRENLLGWESASTQDNQKTVGNEGESPIAWTVHDTAAEPVP
jgi:hypothetical protein